MLEFSWLLFYLVLHLLLVLVTVPWLYWLSQSSWRPGPHWMLRLWTILAVLLFVVPAALLSEGAEQITPQHWFNAEISVLQQQQLHLVETTAAVQTEPALTQRWALAPQLFYLFVPPAWWLVLVPLGCCWQLGRFSQSYRASRQLWLQAQPLSLPDSAHHKPALYQHSAIDSAMLVGLRQPRIILPALWVQYLSAEQLQHVIAHERMHWHRGDLVAFYLQQLFAVLCWWSPFWGLICRQLNQYRELSCDAAVTAQLTQPHRYAQTLLDCSKADCSKTNSRGQPATLAMPWQQQPLLAQRIRFVLQGSAGKITPQSCAVLIALSLSVAATLVLAERTQVARLPAEYAQLSLTELHQLQQLLHKVRQQDLAGVSQLLALGYPLNAAMPGEGTALMLAVRSGDKAMVELLLSAGADVNQSSRRDGNPLIIAAQHGNLVMAKRLVQAGADVNAIVLADETPLINASYIGDLAMVQYLVQQGARVNLKVEATVMDGSELRSPLSRASTAEVRAYLLQQGATP
ncbi:MAG: ankyrin repeat domain-containing protein [Gammaproteobacteria bacterium]|nr:ankyrin repeat domain-containing protein [Gammaproteobacteria bacterium]MBU2056271.1 ankyrin repeat domain-containing protein [Gammaproteobacteria bacterium]MBU2174686.1 ankyrin repeat domain-containing protein [Gammaproteobacteria bacterium]MBU2248847.1 ankyrin repeat domain-containing protein [Gammaproteobacteria bacterium]MBU2344554.1 ankyrin repeat domain-containing protein [Gammaproteobacteria bacterium]